MRFFVLLLFCCFTRISGNFTKCPNGSPIYRKGVTDEDKQIIVDLHNNYRIKLANGQIEGQPRAVNLRKLTWDDTLSHLCDSVSKRCKDEHVIENDPRFGSVGQNIFIFMSSADDGGVPDWKTTVYHWFNEHSMYTFGGLFGAAGHYTQMVWADTNHIGCDFIYFKSLLETSMPYTKIYTCNYGPPGNIYGHLPYQTGESGCEKLC